LKNKKVNFDNTEDNNSKNPNDKISNPSQPPLKGRKNTDQTQNSKSKKNN
jgi:hypothetical protein